MKSKKKLRIEIDKNSGFCFGVVNAISQAEKELQNGETLYCIGEIVHNNMEVSRLQSLGLRTITHAELEELQGQTVLFRAHGEPPETYRKAKEKGIKVIDASCPVVLKLQSRVSEGWKRMQQVGGQVVIYGIKGHAEVLGLVGQTGGEAIIIESMEELDKIDFTKPIELFAQTTKSAAGYKEVAAEIERRMQLAGSDSSVNLKVYNSICRQVENRKSELVNFAKQFDVLIFVSGKNSSNGKMLYEICKSVNPNSFFVSSSQELHPEWFQGIGSVGICGATSTPFWLMEQVADAVENMEIE